VTLLPACLVVLPRAIVVRHLVIWPAALMCLVSVNWGALENRQDRE
jgi:hypothetical protein